MSQLSDAFTLAVLSCPVLLLVVIAYLIRISRVLDRIAVAYLD